MRSSSTRWRRSARWLVSYNTGAAARQPRPGADPHVSAEAHAAGTVPFRSVYLTGKLTVRIPVTQYAELAACLGSLVAKKFRVFEESDNSTNFYPLELIKGGVLRPMCVALTFDENRRSHDVFDETLPDNATHSDTRIEVAPQKELARLEQERHVFTGWRRKDNRR